MAAQTEAKSHVAGVSVSVDGAELDPKWRNAVEEVKVVNTLQLPDMALVRLIDPQGESVDHHPLQIGKKLEIKSAAMGDQSTTTIFKGEIAAVEPEFGANGCIIAIRAYDESHKLNRNKKTRTFQDSSCADMARKVIKDNALTAKTMATDVVHEFFQQSNETDWDFLWRIALMHDYLVVADDQTIHFKPADGATGAAVHLTWQQELISFRPRMSGIQQPRTVEVRAWDPKSKQTVSGQASSPETTSQPGVARSKVSNDLGGGTISVTDRVASDNSEANAIAKSTLQRLADSFYEADGQAWGNPKIKAGVQVQVGGVGNHFGGTFLVTTATHSYRGSTGYRTAFQISGRSSRTLLELMRQPEDRDWSASLVVGTVTNNNDPDSMGRVRVKYPSLSDTEESAWARIATPSAGAARGLLMLPQVGEEVIIGFEHGDTRRPIVVGSLFNGSDKPGEELLQNYDGSFSLLSDQKIHQHSKKDFEIKSDENMTVTIQKDKTETISGNYKNEATGNGNLKAQQYTIEAGSTMTVKGVSLTVEASASLTLKGATIDIQGTGPVNIKGAIINLG
jgi:phage protein D/phage baseplate assembly protein gpV